MNNHTSNVDEMIEIDLREYLKILLDRKEMIIGLMVIAILISGLVSFFVLEPIYQAEATISLSNRAGSYSDVGTARQMLQSMEYFDRINEKLGLGLAQDQLRGIRNNLEINEVYEGDEILELSFQRKEPEEAQLVLDSLIELFRSDSQERFGRNQARIERSLEQVEIEVARLEEGLVEREDRIDQLLTAEELSTADKIILSNEFGSKINDLEQLRYSLLEREYELEEKLDAMEEMQVINQPIVSDNPVAPNKKLNLAIAGVLGLMLGVFVAFMKEFLSEY
ncbi:Wzz/FepE/Etk N-terminal domain-containing protein [Natroniella acetigena]|uniref:YveK family protein n=1 Tax=Natroniella acetigena TaxID=52004 RepID=UPI00200B540E|nr:Wzz/FepE/Etk N-terminal domain-containing protein [Natroniella acetigena]MCK8827678.1 Wzz/FepE/Etk N-terminal domain-containing protein [Natroniella acetigena]